MNTTTRRTIKYRIDQTTKAKLIAWLKAERHRFTNNQKCFEAAVEALGLAGKMRTTSSAVNVYFQQAKALKAAAPATSNGTHPTTDAPKPKRSYRKAVLSVQVNYCPACGCNLVAVAHGIASAALTR